MNRVTAIVCLLTLLPLSGVRAQDPAPNGPKAPKVILIIGDGMDQHQITIARDYLAGYRGRLTLDTLPVRSNVQIQTVADVLGDRLVLEAGDEFRDAAGVGIISG